VRVQCVLDAPGQRHHFRPELLGQPIPFEPAYPVLASDRAAQPDRQLHHEIESAPRASNDGVVSGIEHDDRVDVAVTGMGRVRLDVVPTTWANLINDLGNKCDVARDAREYAVWDVVLSCGHFTQEHTKPRWKPEDGPVHRINKKRRPLHEVLEEIAKGDPDEEAYWRRMYAEHHPDPAPFTRCHTCTCIRTIAAYQRVGWLAGKKAPVKPKPTPRKTLGRRLRKLESEAAQLRKQLDGLPTDE
jgi:hypothetical protein